MMESVEQTAPACEYVIETAGWRDLNAVRRLEQVCFPKDAWPLWDVIGVLTLPSVVRLKATCGGELVGFIAGDIRRSEGTAWIATIGVLPEYRRRGIGAALLEACEAQIELERVRLCVRTTNEAAIHLYQRMGYSKVGEWKQYYHDGETAQVMEKWTNAARSSGRS